MGERFHNVELCCIFDITDPLYLPLKCVGLVWPHLECPRNLYKSLSVSLFSKKSNCLSLFRGDGRGVRNDELSVYCVGYYRPPLTPPKVGRTGLSASWGSLCVVCPYLEGPLERSANCIFIQLRRAYPVWKNRRWMWILLHVEASRNRCPINFK